MSKARAGRQVQHHPGREAVGRQNQHGRVGEEYARDRDGRPTVGRLQNGGGGLRYQETAEYMRGRGRQSVDRRLRGQDHRLRGLCSKHGHRRFQQSVKKQQQQHISTTNIFRVAMSCSRVFSLFCSFT